MAVGSLIGVRAIETHGMFRQALERDGQGPEGRSIGDSPEQRGAVLFFHSEHCPACRAMEGSLPHLVEACDSTSWDLLPIDVDSSENDELIEHYRVRAVPTLSFVDGDGKERAHLVGVQSPSRLRATIERTLTVACSPDPSFPLENRSETGGATCAVGKPC